MADPAQDSQGSWSSHLFGGGSWRLGLVCDGAMRGVSPKLSLSPIFSSSREVAVLDAFDSEGLIHQA